MRRFLSPRRGSVCLSYAVKSITPKSGKVRVVPRWTAGHQLGRLAGRERMSADDGLVFASALGGHLDGRALRRRSYDSALVTQGHVGRRAGSPTSPETGSSTPTAWSATRSDTPATTTPRRRR